VKEKISELLAHDCRHCTLGHCFAALSVRIRVTALLEPTPTSFTEGIGYMAIEGQDTLRDQKKHFGLHSEWVEASSHRAVMSQLQFPSHLFRGDNYYTPSTREPPSPASSVLKGTTSTWKIKQRGPKDSTLLFKTRV